MDTLYFGQSSAGTADGSSWANRAAFLAGGAINTLITSRDYGTDGPLTAYVEGDGAEYSVTSSVDLGTATGYDVDNYCLLHGCDSSGNPLSPGNPGWTSAQPSSAMGYENFPKITAGTTSLAIDLGVGAIRCFQTKNSLTSYGSILRASNYDWMRHEQNFSHNSAAGYGTHDAYYNSVTNCAFDFYGTDGAWGISFGTNNTGMVSNVRAVGHNGRIKGVVNIGVYDTSQPGCWQRLTGINCDTGCSIGGQRNIYAAQVKNCTFIDCTIGVHVNGDGSTGHQTTRSTVRVSDCLFSGCGEDIRYTEDTVHQVKLTLLATNNRHKDTITARLAGDWLETFEEGAYTTAATDADEFVGGGDYRIGKQALTHGMGFGVADQPKETYANQVRPTNLVGHWSASLDDDGAGTTTATDLSGNGHNGTQNGGLTEVADPSFNGVRAWDQDGTDDYISIPDSDDFTFVNGGADQPFTISTWVKFNAINTGSVQGLVTKGDAATTGEWQLTEFSGILYWRTTDQSGAIYYGQGTNVAGLLVTGKWMHIVCTFDGRTANPDAYKIYVNGVEASAYTLSSNGTPSAMQNTTHPVLIGRRGTSTETDASFDDTRIYNCVLTLDEIEALAASRIGREPLTDQNWKGVLDGLTVYHEYEYLYISSHSDSITSQRWITSGASEATAKIGKGIDYAGSKVSYPSGGDSFTPTSKFYFCTWAYFPSSGAGSSRTIASKYNFSGDERGWLLMVTSSNVLRWIASSDGTTTNWVDLVSTLTPPTDAWVFLEAWIDLDADLMGVALNRVEQTIANTYSTVHASSSATYLGSHSTSQDFFNGKLDETALCLEVIPSDANRDWIYNEGAGRTLEEWRRRQLRTPIIEVTGGGGGTRGFAHIG